MLEVYVTAVQRRKPCMTANCWVWNYSNLEIRIINLSYFHVLKVNRCSCKYTSNMAAWFMLSLIQFPFASCLSWQLGLEKSLHCIRNALYHCSVMLTLVLSQWKKIRMKCKWYKMINCPLSNETNVIWKTFIFQFGQACSTINDAQVAWLW